jgi:hypothetical protein
VWPKPIRISEDSYQLENILAGNQKKRPILVRQRNKSIDDSKSSKEVIEPRKYLSISLLFALYHYT